MPTRKNAKLSRSNPDKDDLFASRYPNLGGWIKGGGWLEIGYTDFTQSFVRVLDTGGMIWEGKASYKSIDAALQAAEDAVIRWQEENG